MKSLHAVQPPLKFIPPAFNEWTFRAFKPFLPIWLRTQVKISEIEVKHTETLVDLYHQFQSQKIRFLIAFRHPSTTDPACLSYLLAHEVPRVARQRKILLQDIPFAHFIYDRGVPLWLGSVGSWILPRIGAFPMLRGKLDRQGLRKARELAVSGRFPLAIAPEGGINGNSRVVTALEPGTAQLGFWCLEDLEKAGQSIPVMILPIGIQYSYLKDPASRLEKVLAELEKSCGIIPLLDPSLSFWPQIQQRILRLCEQILNSLEKFYAQFYGVQVYTSEEWVAVGKNGDLKVPASDLRHRLFRVLDAALQVPEAHFGLKPRKDLMERRHCIEQAGWDRIFREDLEDVTTLSEIERSLANRVAQESDRYLWHMRLAETFIGVAEYYQETMENPAVDPLSTREAMIETVLRLWAVTHRLKDKEILHLSPPYLGDQKATITIGSPLAVRDYQERYQSNRRQGVTDLTHDLQRALEGMIDQDLGLDCDHP
jgi:1-acyl-sn-glycerol-3-phosphate acyltransferase